MLYPLLKRTLDIAVAGIGLLILGIPMMIIALVVLSVHGRPVIFKQARPGFEGRPYILYKFRTMTNRVDKESVLLPDGDRLTGIGRFLRSTSLDELPEFWNVLRGDMSLVGPRPLLTRYLDRYTPEQRRRHEVKPGLTGWAQVNGRNAITWEEKFTLDVWYVEHRSFRLDCRILFLTLWKMVKREGINQAGQATMEEFMGSPPQPSGQSSGGTK